MVNGTVTPDTWHLDKATLGTVEERIAEKERMTITAVGAAREVGVPSFLKARPSLEPAQLAEVAALARDLELQQGWPVDVEWAIEPGASTCSSAAPSRTAPPRRRRRPRPPTSPIRGSNPRTPSASGN